MTDISERSQAEGEGLPKSANYPSPQQENNAPIAKVSSASSSKTSSGPDSGDPTDGRKEYEWKTRYSGDGAWDQIIIEAIYTVVVALVALILIFIIWRGVIPRWLAFNAHDAKVFQTYGYYLAAGLLGGTVFCLKYLYRAVARGWWHEDRRLWRFISPLVAMSVAFAIGALIQSKLISFAVQSRSSGIIGTGFLIGYFGDQAVAKLHEIANVLFGTSTRSS